MSETLLKDYIAKVVERAALTREKFVESNIPANLNSLVVVPFFGDIRSEFVLSTLVLNKWKELNRFSYLVVCSWPGHHGLYPYADEFWSISDPSMLSNLLRGVNPAGFSNANSGFLEKILLRYLDNPQLMLPDDQQITKYYNGGVTVQYLRESGDVLYSLPTVPATNIALARALDPGKKSVLVMPTLYVNTWKRKGTTPTLTTKSFWIDLVKSLGERYSVVVYQNYFTHDLSGDIPLGSVILADWNIMSALAVMRSVDCVIDVFNQTAKYAYMARAPVLVVDERQRYFGIKDYEIDDLCAKAVPKQYLFSFAPIIEGDHDFIIEAIVNKVALFISSCDRSRLPSTAASATNISYAEVRKREIKRVGMQFIVPHKLDEEID